MEELLPVGSIVETKDNRRLMIIGYYPNKINDKCVKEYVCCRKTDGIIKKNESIKYNKDYFYISKSDIKNVLFVGYSDNEFTLFSSVLTKINDSISSNSNKDIEAIGDDINNIINELIAKQKNRGDSGEK